MVAAAAVAEERFDAVEELLLPLTDLDGVDLIRSDELGEGLGLLGGLQSDLGLEGAGYRFLVPFMMPSGWNRDLRSV